MAYGSNLEMDTYWAQRGYVVSGLNDAAKNAARAKATDYVDGLGYRDTGGAVRTVMWPGTPVSAGQIEAWPRSGAVDIYGNAISDSAVPTRVLSAVYEAAFFSASGGDLNRSISMDRLVTKRKVDTIETTYAEPKHGIDTKPVIPAVADLLAPLLVGGESNRYGITLVAVS